MNAENQILEHNVTSMIQSEPKEVVYKGGDRPEWPERWIRPW